MVFDDTTVFCQTCFCAAILYQLHLHRLSNCKEWVVSYVITKLMSTLIISFTQVMSTSDRLKDISDAILQLVQGSCQCTYTALNIDGEVFRCFDGAEDSVTYRARVLATVEVDTQSLSSYLEEWVAAGSSVVVGGVVMSVDEDCSGEIADLLQEEEGCRAEPTSSDSTGVVAGAVVGAAVAALVVATVIIIACIVIVKRRYVTIINNANTVLCSSLACTVYTFM